VSATSVILLGIEIDWKLTLNKHVHKISKNTNNKAKALSHHRYKLDLTQKLSSYDSYVLSMHCP